MSRGDQIFAFRVELGALRVELGADLRRFASKPCFSLDANLWNGFMRASRTGSPSLRCIRREGGQLRPCIAFPRTAGARVGRWVGEIEGAPRCFGWAASREPPFRVSLNERGRFSASARPTPTYVRSRFEDAAVIGALDLSNNEKLAPNPRVVEISPGT